MRRSRPVERKRTLLLAVAAVASGVTISCGDSPGIGLYNVGWDAAFYDAANPQKTDGGDAATDGSSDSAAEASADAGDATDATSD